MSTEITTHSILEESIKDIEAGRWMCGHLTTRCDAKPMGCAVGLVGINAGLAKLTNLNDGTYIAELSYPDESKEETGEEWPDNALRAIKLLSLTTGETVEDTSEFDDLNAVIAFNDAHGDHALTPQSAADWFRRALALA